MWRNHNNITRNRPHNNNTNHLFNNNPCIKIFSNKTNNGLTNRQGEDAEDEQDEDEHKADTDVANNNIIEGRILHINLHITQVKVDTNNNTNRLSTHTIPTPQKYSLTTIIAGPTATIYLMTIIVAPVSNQQYATYGPQPKPAHVEEVPEINIK